MSEGLIERIRSVEPSLNADIVERINKGLKNLHIHMVDKEADMFVDFLCGAYESQGKHVIGIDSEDKIIYDTNPEDAYDIVIEAHNNQIAGLEGLNGSENTVVLSGVYGNGKESAMLMIGLESAERVKPWADIGIEDYIKLLKQHDPQPKVLIYSGSTFSHEEAVRMGAEGFIEKPIRLNDLVERIEYVARK